MTPKELIARMEQQKNEIAALKSYWETLFPEVKEPGDRQWLVWLNMPYDFETVVYGLEKSMQQWNKKALEAGTKEGALPMQSEQIVPYASGCMKKHKQEMSNGNPA
jgi:hypothetical protein